MALGAYDALQYVAPRDPAVTAEVQRVYELGRAGYLIRYLNSVAGLAAHPRMMSKAAALIMLHSLGRITTPNKAQSDASVTTLPEFKLQTIQRQVELIETIYQRQRALTGTEQPVSNLPAQMPLLQRPSGYPAPLSPQERIAYAYFDMLQQEGQLMQRRMGW